MKTRAKELARYYKVVVAVKLGSNSSSLQAQRRLAEGTAALSRTFERLSSGQRINRAADDAAGLAISSALNSTSRVLGQGTRNINDGISYLTVAEGALSELSTITLRQLELAEQAANGSYSVTQRRALTNEANALVEEFNRIVASTEFNGRKVLDVRNSGGEVRVQASYGVDGSLAFAIGSELDRDVGDGTFTAATSFYANGQVYGVSTEDVNGDGLLDVISSNGGDDTISIMLGNGDGSFKTSVSIPIGFFQRSVTIIDINGDQKADIISGSNGTLEVSILIGNGDGTFKAVTSIPMNFPDSIIVADFNNDGWQDIVGGTGTEVRILLGNGNGTFQAYRTFATVNASGSVTQGDVNGDGKLDIISSSEVSDSISVLLGNGDGTFQAPLLWTPGDGPVQTAIGDLNGDGFLDLMTTLRFDDRVAVLLGNGNGTFRAPISYIAGDYPVGSTLKDFNGDGRLDIAIANSFDPSIGVLIGNGDGSFRAMQTFAAANSVQSVVTADFNRDGRLDILSNNRSTGAFNIMLGNGDSTTSIAYLNLNTAQDARTSLDTLNLQQSRISNELGRIGAFQSRLIIAANNLVSARENYIAASSRIQDADIASESANLVRQNILQQATAAVLSQANLQPQLALTLLEN